MAKFIQVARYFFEVPWGHLINKSNSLDEEYGDIKRKSSKKKKKNKKLGRFQIYLKFMPVR